MSSRRPMSLYFKERNPRNRSWQPHFLIRGLGLAVWDDWLLTRRAEIEMMAVALMLLVVLLFDWGAWFLLFNAILHSQLLAFDLLTLPAFIAGGAIAAAVVIYERQFVTADLTGGWRRVVVPMGLRLLVILASAAITAQPVELLFFREPIQNRMHEEGIRVHVGNMLRKLDTIDLEIVDAQDSANEAKNASECKASSDAQQNLEDEENEQVNLTILKRQQEAEEQRWQRNINTYSTQRDEAERRLQELEQAWHRDQENLDPQEAERRQTELDEARQAFEKAARNFDFSVSKRNEFRRAKNTTAGKLARTEGMIPVLQSRLDAREQKCKEVKTTEGDRARQLEELARLRQDQVRAWVRELIEADPGVADGKKTVIDKVPVTYQLPSYDFFAQLRVLHDLRTGVPPRWKGSTGPEIDRMSREFGLSNARNCDDLKEGEEECTDEEREMWESLKTQARQFHWSWIAVYAIAVIIPLLVIAIKFLFPDELKNYYSIAHQDAAGNPEARRLMEIRKKVDNKVEDHAPERARV